MGDVIDGKALSLVVKEDVKRQVAELEKCFGRKPCLAVILVGDDAASRTYVGNKLKAATYTGMDTLFIELPTNVTERVLLDKIVELNKNSAIDGILVQLPLPKNINEATIIDAVSPEKDVDGFHPKNVAGLWLEKDCIIPCTPAGIIRIIESVGCDLNGKNALVVGRSNIVGKPVAKLLMDRNATVAIAHSHTVNLGSLCRMADVLVVAVGKEGLIDGTMIKPGAVVIDVGMNRNVSGKLCGDVDFESVKPIASWITPVPGGVGPMTIAMLMNNVLHCFQLCNQKGN